MCIPPIDDDPGYHFNKLKLLANENKIDELSIGMSDDYMRKHYNLIQHILGLEQFYLEKEYEKKTKYIL